LFETDCPLAREKPQKNSTTTGIKVDRLVPKTMAKRMAIRQSPVSKRTPLHNLRWTFTIACWKTLPIWAQRNDRATPCAQRDNRTYRGPRRPEAWKLNTNKRRATGYDKGLD